MFILANWKAYVEDLTKARTLLALSKRLARETKNVIVLAPPAPLIGALTQRNRSKVAFAAQDVSVTTGGAQTGEATVSAYKTVGVTYALIGHSERRTLGDTTAVIAEKLAHALAHGLAPILCVGERKRDSEGHYLSFVREEIASAVEPLGLKDRAKIIIAYEPLWAIGRTADDAIKSSDLTEMVFYIRKVLAEFLPGKGADRVPILYGGSVEPGNARDLAASSGVDGFLVGHASVDPHAFALLVKHLS